MTASRDSQNIAAEAIKDLGWFPLIALFVVSGPSILSILQLVFVDHRLVPALQWIVESYNSLMGILAAIIEPGIFPLVSWLNNKLEWHLILYPHWRPLFTLTMVLVIAYARTVWRDGRQFAAVAGTLLGAMGCLTFAILSGLSPLNGSLLVQLLASFFPFALLALYFVPIQVILVDRGFFKLSGTQTMAKFFHYLKIGVLGGAVSLVALFLIFTVSEISQGKAIGAAWLSESNAPGGTGVVIVGLLMAFIGIFCLSAGLIQKNVRVVRLAFTVLGGFISACVIMLADLIIRHIG